jgi:hypothetical protein
MNTPRGRRGRGDTVRSRGATTAMRGRWDGVQREQGRLEAVGGHDVGFVADLQLEGGRGAG